MGARRPIDIESDAAPGKAPRGLDKCSDSAPDVQHYWARDGKLLEELQREAGIPVANLQMPVHGRMRRDGFR